MASLTPFVLKGVDVLLHDKVYLYHDTEIGDLVVAAASNGVFGDPEFTQPTPNPVWISRSLPRPAPSEDGSRRLAYGGFGEYAALTFTSAPEQLIYASGVLNNSNAVPWFPLDANGFPMPPVEGKRMEALLVLVANITYGEGSDVVVDGNLIPPAFGGEDFGENWELIHGDGDVSFISGKGTSVSVYAASTTNGLVPGGYLDVNSMPSHRGPPSVKWNWTMLIGVMPPARQAPPCRVYPRADSLGHGSGRTWPPPGTRQGGRLSGPY